jgi:hypothetical protein
MPQLLGCASIAAYLVMPPPLSAHVSLQAALKGVPAGLVAGVERRLEAIDASDRLAEVLDEVQRVRDDLGTPPAASPLGDVAATRAAAPCGGSCARGSQRQTVSRRAGTLRTRLQQRKHRRGGVARQHAARANVQGVRRRGESAGVRSDRRVIGAQRQQRQQRGFVAGGQRRQRGS